MRRWILLAALALAAGCKPEEAEQQIRFVAPPHFPEPVYKTAQNPVTPAGFALGKKLFYDGRLSRDGSISCGSCHQQPHAFTHHGHDLSHGIDDKMGIRNTPPLQNLAWQKAFFWDGGVFHLDLLPIAPIENPVEMDETMANVIRKLQDSEDYPPLFREAFGSEEISSTRMLQALSQFMIMLVSASSPYDQHLLGDPKALSEEQKKGLALFEAKCASCHSGPLLSDESYRSNGLPLGNDPGRYQITLQEEDRYKFKVPSLRNVARSGPYMHNGSIRSLRAVLDHYASGMSDHPAVDPAFRQPGGALGIPLSETEKLQILAFLECLTDPEYLSDPRFSEY